MSSFLEIGSPVPEKNIFEGSLPYELRREKNNALFSDLVRQKKQQQAVQLQKMARGLKFRI